MKMKKYLMTGIAALALCAGFTSCSHDLEPMSQDEIDQMEAQKVVKAYENAFRNQFGNPASNQDWGFGVASTRTRTTVDPNGNMWADAPGIGVNEEDDVVNYVHELEVYSKDDAINLKDYYVTHIHKGLDEDYNEYTDYNGQATFFGSNKMDQLIIADKKPTGINNSNGALADKDSWYHVYDFNNGENTDWSGNMRVTDSGSLNFAYFNSLDNKWHDRWIAVKGSDINEELYGDYIYICFDYESIPKDDTENFTMVSWAIPGMNNPTAKPREEGGEWYNRSCKIYGAYSPEMLVGMSFTDPSHTEEGAYEWGQTGTSYWEVTQVSQGDKLVEGNNDYTDWIIRLKAINTSGDEPGGDEPGGDEPGGDEPGGDEPGGDEPTADLRIIAEDLTTGTSADDFDFNDVVFDVYYSKDGQPAKAIILAAGGTLKLRVDGKEVHDEFASVNPGTNCTGMMINTNGENSSNAYVRSHSLKLKNLPEITLSKTVTTPAEARDNIKVEVYKNEQWIELKAETGKVASKVRVGIDYVWKNEREYVGDGFKDFVAGKVGYNDWYNQ